MCKMCVCRYTDTQSNILYVYAGKSPRCWRCTHSQDWIWPSAEANHDSMQCFTAVTPGYHYARFIRAECQMMCSSASKLSTEIQFSIVFTIQCSHMSNKHNKMNWCNKNVSFLPAIRMWCGWSGFIRPSCIFANRHKRLTAKAKWHWCDWEAFSLYPWLS